MLPGCFIFSSFNIEGWEYLIYPVYYLANPFCRQPAVKTRFAINNRDRQAVYVKDFFNARVIPPPGGAVKDPGATAQPAPKVGDYFPLTAGSSWQYLGEGNEYASFNRLVIFAKENRAQVKSDNGGTVAAMVFEITDTAITRIYMKGEEYGNPNFLDAAPNENLIILKTPLETGTIWENSTGGTREITDVNAVVNTPAGRFEKCVKVKITNPDSAIYEYYKEGVGLVRSEFQSGGAIITSTLEKYNIK